MKYESPRRNQIEEQMKKGTAIVACAIIAAALSGCEPIQRHTETITVRAVEKQSVTGGSNGSISTHIYWLVNTDKGTFRVETSGLWACPEATGLRVDSTYAVTIDGFFKSPFLGAYPYITAVSNK